MNLEMRLICVGNMFLLDYFDATYIFAFEMVHQ